MGKKITIYDRYPQTETAKMLKEIGIITGSIFGILEATYNVYMRIQKLNNNNKKKKKLSNATEIEKNENNISLVKVIGVCLILVGGYLCSLE